MPGMSQARKELGDARGLGQGQSWPVLTSSQGNQPVGPELPPQGSALWVWAALKAIGLEGLPGGSSDPVLQVPLPPLPNVLVIPSPSPVPQPARSSRGAPAGPLQAVHQFRYLGTPRYSYVLGSCSGPSTASDVISALVTCSFTQVSSLAQGCTARKGVQPAGPLLIHLIWAWIWSHPPSSHTRDRSGSQGPAKCPQADGAATRWEPCRGRDRRDARPWEQAPGWADRADPWAPLALMPGQTGPLGGSFCLVGPERRAWELQASGQQPGPQSHGCPSDPLRGAGICAFMGTRSQPWGT